MRLQVMYEKNEKKKERKDMCICVCVCDRVEGTFISLQETSFLTTRIKRRSHVAV